MVTVTRKKGKLYIKCNYYEPFNKKMSNLGGRWDGASWVVTEALETSVRALLMAVWGTDGSPCDLVNILVTTPRGLRSADRTALYVGPIQLARAFGRDSGARVCDNVAVLEGSIRSGGSMKNWCAFAEDGTVFKVMYVPAPLAQRLVAEHADNKDLLVAIEGENEAPEAGLADKIADVEADEARLVSALEARYNALGHAAAYASATDDVHAARRALAQAILNAYAASVTAGGQIVWKD